MYSKGIKLLLLLVVVATLLPGPGFTGTTGKIAGTVKDKATGEPLPMVNIIIEGTQMGAATDIEGYYFIINIPPGKYSIRASMMGYKQMVQQEVQVIIDMTTTINFELETTVLEGEEVVITAERPLIEKDVTASSTVTSGEQIDVMPVNTYQEVLVTTPGFVESGTGLDRNFNVRGGRGGELAYMIDGFYVEDPQTGGMGGDVSNVGIAEMAVMTGTFNAEYGEAMSGILNIVTREGGSAYNGRIRFRTDKGVNPRTIKYPYKRLRIVDGQETDWINDQGELVSDVGTADAVPGTNKNASSHWFTKEKKITDNNTYRFDAYAGGPIPLLGKNNTFFVSGDILDTDTYLGWTGVPFDRTYRANGKIVLKPLQNLKLTLGGVYTDREYRDYYHGYKYIPDAVEPDYENNYMLNFTITHSLSPSTFYTVKGSHFATDDYYYTFDEDEFFVFENPATGKKYVGRQYLKNYVLGDSLDYAGKAERVIVDEEYEFNKGWWEYEYDENDNIIDSTWTVGGGNEFYERKTTISSLKFDITSQVLRTHQVKAGVEAKSLYLHYFYVYAPYSAAPEWYNYTHYPVEGSAYLQDKMEFEDWGLVVNAGVRLDYMDTKAKYFADPYNPTGSDIEKAKYKLHLSPRLGLAHPITDKMVLHFAYGHFYQVPQYNYLFFQENMDWPTYPYPDMSINGIYTQIGNANLKPEKTIAYELGMQMLLLKDIALDVTFYYKDIYDYESFERFQATPNSYHRLVNMDYANSKGVEISLEKRFSNFFGGTFNYTYSRAEGNAAGPLSHFNDWYSYSVYKTYPPKKTVTMNWDQTHTYNFILDFHTSRNWAVNILGNYGSGLPYTPLSGRGLRLDEVNSARRPWTMTVDLRATKMFYYKGMEFALFADLNNVLNKRNVLAVYGTTGKPDATTDWDDTVDFLTRPNHFSPPRTLELGLSIGF